MNNTKPTKTREMKTAKEYFTEKFHWLKKEINANLRISIYPEAITNLMEAYATTHHPAPVTEDDMNSIIDSICAKNSEVDWDSAVVGFKAAIVLPGFSEEWISVENRLPEEHRPVIITTDSERRIDIVYCGWLSENNIWYIENGFDGIEPINVTYWRPLPKPPQAGRSDKPNQSEEGQG